jgi:hypothetical protein
MILLVGMTEQGELAGAVVSEQINEIQRALDLAFRAVLDRVGHLE